MTFDERGKSRMRVGNCLKSILRPRDPKNRHRLITAVCLMAAFILLVPAANAQQAGTMPGTQEYSIGAGDVLDVVVYGEQELSRTVFVRIDGRISLPLAGEVEAAGAAPAVLAEKITEKLARFIEEPNVSVILAESRSKAYYMVGQVKTPGEYSITRQVTVLQAIARAGGFLEWAKKDRIMIVSGPESDEEITYFDYEGFLGGKDRTRNVVIHPGDTIVVP